MKNGERGQSDDPIATAIGCVDTAAAIIADTGYHRRVPDLALVRSGIALAHGNAAAAQPHLAEAKRWIDDGWGCHVAEYDALIAQLSPPASLPSPGDAPSPPSPSPAAKTMWQRIFGG